MAAVLKRDVKLPGEIAAWLYAPEGAKACVVMAHGLSAVRDQRLPAYAERFAQAGLAALLFDYRGFGASAGEPRQVVDIERQLETGARRSPTRAGRASSGSGCSARLRRRPRARVAAEEHGLGAVVAQCPMTDGLLASLMTPPRRSRQLLEVALQDQLGSLAGRRPKLIKAAGAPGELALMSSPDIVPGFESITPPTRHG